MRSDRPRAGAGAGPRRPPASAPPIPCPPGPTSSWPSTAGGPAPTLDELLALGADVVVVAATHDQLTPLAQRALEAGSHVLVEKPAALGTSQVDSLLQAAERAGRRVKVGFNHRFHPALRDLASEVHSGAHGEAHARARAVWSRRPAWLRGGMAGAARNGPEAAS